MLNATQVTAKTPVFLTLLSYSIYFGLRGEEKGENVGILTFAC